MMKNRSSNRVDERKIPDQERDGTTEILKDTVYVAPRTGPTVLVDVAPETHVHQSKRYDGMHVLGRDLDRKKLFLREQALEKEKIFKQNVANLRKRYASFREKLDVEIQQRDVEHEQAKAVFETKLERMVQHAEDELAASYTVVRDDWIPPQAKRLDDWKEDFDHFVNVTVPETIENQSGRVTRHLIKAQETFEIDNTKLLRREDKIRERYAKHVENAKRNQFEVTRKRKDCFILLEEDMLEEERKSDRAEEVHHIKNHKRIGEVQKLQSGLAGIRAQTDSEILICIEETMSRLQKSVLDNFGLHAEYK